MSDRRHLRPVGPDERMPELTGSVATVIDDLEIAHGHIVEARAEVVECAGDEQELSDLGDALLVADAAVTKALRHAHMAKRQ